jgi:hypothetical protein
VSPLVFARLHPHPPSITPLPTSHEFGNVSGDARRDGERDVGLTDPTSAAGAPKRELSIEAVTELREKTAAIAALLRKRLDDQLEALRPLFAPQRILGRRVRSGTRDDVPGAERAYARLKERYSAACGRPFSLPRELEDEALAIDPVLEPAPFVYRHRLGSEGAPLVAITNPLYWTLSYRCAYSLPELESGLENRATFRPVDAQQFVLGALALQLLLEAFPEIPRLLEELRYEVRIEKRPHLGELPLLTVRAGLPTFRPPDPTIATATRFSGVQAFIELIDIDALDDLRDPLHERISAALGE